MTHFFKRLFTIVVAAAVAAASTVISASAESGFGQRDKNGVPVVIQTEPLTISGFSGKYELSGNICYFVDKTMTINRDITLPESSMMVVRNGANLKIGAGATLTINGTLAVHTGAKINPQKDGSLVFGENSIGVINGTLAVSSDGSASVSGYAQCGRVNVKGSLNVDKNGSLVYDKKKIYPEASVTGELTLSAGTPQYMVWELEAADNNDIKLVNNISGESGIYQNRVYSGTYISRLFESILYRYNGEIELPPNVTADEFRQKIGYNIEGTIEHKDGIVRFGTNSWHGTAFFTDSEQLKGSFYSIVKGCTMGLYMADLIWGDNHPVGKPITVPFPDEYWDE